MRHPRRPTIPHPDCRYPIHAACAMAMPIRIPHPHPRPERGGGAELPDPIRLGPAPIRCATPSSLTHIRPRAPTPCLPRSNTVPPSRPHSQPPASRSRMPMIESRANVSLPGDLIYFRRHPSPHLPRPSGTRCPAITLVAQPWALPTAADSWCRMRAAPSRAAPSGVAGRPFGTGTAAPAGRPSAPAR